MPDASTSRMLDQYAMSKGLKMVDDDDDEAVTHHEMTADHELVIHIEHCKADRPSKMGSLKGCKENYETKARDIETVIKSLSLGDGTLQVASLDLLDRGTVAGKKRLRTA